jgi:hypothetical protein
MRSGALRIADLGTYPGTRRHLPALVPPRGPDPALLVAEAVGETCGASGGGGCWSEGEFEDRPAQAQRITRWR